MDPTPDRDCAIRRAYARGQLEAPVQALREYARMLRAPVADASLTADLAKLTTLADGLHDHVQRVFEAPDVENPEKRRVLRHDLRGQASRIVTLCDLLIEDEGASLPAGMQAELEQIRAVAHRVIKQINGVLDMEPGRDTGEGLDLEAILGKLTPTVDRKVEPGRILLADDNADNRDLITKVLMRWGSHSVLAVADGEAALTALATEEFDVVLLDVIMPGLDGFEVLRRIRDHPQLRHIPVVMMSALGEEGAVIAGIAAGADDYVRRPFSPALLAARVNACIERKRYRDRELAYQRQIETLFRALFPPEVADEVRERGTIPPRRHDPVGVLFADVVGFTRFCEAHKDQPEEVVEYLQDMVSRWEFVAARHGVQKIKTIGDAFLGTAGVPHPDPSPVETLVRCAMDMIRTVADHPARWEIRIGLHVGPVMAGVIGTTQFQFDVFGDTVNLAARLQSLARPGGVVLSGAARSAIPGSVPLSPREVDVHGVGRITVWDLDIPV